MRITTQDGRILTLQLGDNPVGRAPDNALVVPNLSVSRHHACLRWDGNTLYVFDNHSVNGTWLEGRRLPPDQHIPVRPGASLRFGDDLRVQVSADPEPAYAGAPGSAGGARGPIAPAPQQRARFGIAQVQQ